MPMEKTDFGRAIVIHVCKDGTISYRTRKQKVFNGVALPVFTVDTEDEARALQVRFGRCQYGEHPQLPGRPWYRWTNFTGNADDLDAVADQCRAWYATLKEKSHD